MSYLGRSRSQITVHVMVWGNNSLTCQEKAKPASPRVPLQKCHLPPEIAQGCHIALKGTAAPAVLRAQPCAVGVHRQVSGSSVSPTRAYEDGYKTYWTEGRLPESREVEETCFGLD